MKRKLLSLFLAIAIVSGLPVAPMVSAVAIPESADVSRAAAQEGIVLLENDGVLPLASDAKVALFGHARHMNGGAFPEDGYGKDGFITYGGGSGEVTAPYVVDLLEGLENSVEQSELGAVNYVGVDPSAAAIEEAAESADVAVAVIRRWTAEASDIGAGAGGYLLSAAETNMLGQLNAAFDNVIVIMNAGNALDMTWVENYENVNAVLYAWYPGMEGGAAIADAICGVVNPSGKLVDTFARSLADYPSSATFAQPNPQYTEDIYVGYRYFATADPDYEKVKYEFGYGLSYTTFEIAEKAVRQEGDELIASAKVTNTGEYPGKEVLQVYFSAPAGELNKPAFELAAYAKTGLLAPGASEILEMRFPIASMSSYDDLGKTGAISAYVMEAGDYNIFIGNSVKNATKSDAAGKYEQTVFAVTEQLAKRIPPSANFDRLIDPVDNAYESTGWIPEGGAPAPGAFAPIPGAEPVVEPVGWTGEGTIMLADVYAEPGLIYDFVDQMTDAELRAMSIHQGSSIHVNGTGAIGKMAKYGIPEVNTADGPAGIRIGSIGQRTVAATCMPIGTMVACTWNTPLIYEVGDAVGAEMEANRIDIWLAPGMNIHRHPRNGRNFEYYSEDPLVTGKTGAAMTKGVEDRGGLVTIKHFAANNQETNRYYTNSIVSERALREIYLKGYEIVVKEADPGCLMTSYNRVNGSFTEGSYDLLTNILRNEWGFTGMVMTDWWNGRAPHAQQIAAGCNVKMDSADGSINQVSREALKANIIEVMNTVMRSFAFAQEISPEPRLTGVSLNPIQVVVDKPATVEVTVTGRNLDGQAVTVGLKGYPQTFVTVPGNNGSTVAINVPGDLPLGDYDVVMTLNGVESATKATLRVDVEKEYFYLVALSNNKIVGADPATFTNPGNMTTMVANLDEPTSYAQFEVLRLVPDSVNLRMINNHLITMEGNSYGNQMVRPRTPMPAGIPPAQGWETLMFEDQGDGSIKIKRVSQDGAWYINVAGNGNLSTVPNAVGDSGKFNLVSLGSADPDPMISGVVVSPSRINEGAAVDLSVTVSGGYLDASTVQVGVKGYLDSFVDVVGADGGTVTISVAQDMLTAGDYDIVVTVDGVEQGVKGSLTVVDQSVQLPAAGDVIYLTSVRTGEIVGADPLTFGPPVDNDQPTMVANLDEPTDYALFEVSYPFGGVVLKAKNGYYVSMEGAAYGANKVRPRIEEEALAADGWENLEFEIQNDGAVKIKRTKSFDLTHYIDVNANGELVSVRTDAPVGDSGKFTFTIVDPGDIPPEPTHCTVTFDLNYIGAPDNPMPREIEIGAAIGELPAPTGRPGFVFNGWYSYDGKTTVSETNATLMPTLYSPETIVTADTDLVANWSRVLRLENDGSTAKATAYLSDQAIDAESVRVIVAIYGDRGQLLNYAESDAIAVPEKKPLRLTEQYPADVFGLDSAAFDSFDVVANVPDGAQDIKAFLWDAETYEPICVQVEPVEFELVWSDEFDGAELDAAKWQIPADNGGGGNNEIQYYRPQNASINKVDAALEGSADGSALRIHANSESGLPRGSWASSKLTTQGLFDVQYGRIEARMKTPTNDQGFWPAFWMMPATDTYGGWASAGEIDILENKSRQSGMISSALHFGGAWAPGDSMSPTRNRYQTLRAGAEPTVDGNIPVDTILPDFSVGEWHTYAVEWYPDRLEYFVDGVRYQEINTWYTTYGGERLQQSAPLDQPFYLILNLAVGGNFDGGRQPAASSVGDMYVDYVRVYE